MAAVWCLHETPKPVPYKGMSLSRGKFVTRKIHFIQGHPLGLTGFGRLCKTLKPRLSKGMPLSNTRFETSKIDLTQGHLLGRQASHASTRRSKPVCPRECPCPTPNLRLVKLISPKDMPLEDRLLTPPRGAQNPSPQGNVLDFDPLGHP